jgi:hypothetical protein
MSDQFARVVVADLSGGRNSVDPPLSPLFGDRHSVDAVNVDYYRSTLGNKRNGSSASGVSFSSGGPFTGKISALYRHVPGTDSTLAEEWAVDDAATPVVGRKAAATTFTAPTLKDAITGNAWDVSFASLDGKNFMAYKSAVARLHCWDTATVRRTGLATPAAPAVADTVGAGTYAAIKAYWRVRWIDTTAGSVRRSEPSASTSFTPTGVNLSATITRPAVAGEGETAWELEVSLDNVTFYVLYGTDGLLAAVAIGTTTASSGTAQIVSYIASLKASPATGTFTIQKPYKFIAADNGRLLGFGSWTATDRQNDVEVSAVIGSRDVGDAERVDTTGGYRFGLDEHDSGAPTGLRGPVFGNFYAFKSTQFWELAPTGQSANPYRRTPLSKTIGCVQGPASCVGEDATGNSALYFMSQVGVYRYGTGGLEYIGKGIEDYVRGPNGTINLSATKVIAHLTYHAEKRQVWVWWATGSSNDPCQLAILDVAKSQIPGDGWTRVPTGDKLANARCSMAFSNTIAAAMSLDLKPYLGSALTANIIYKGDDAAVTDDAGTAFQAYVLTKPIEPGGPGFNGRVGDPMLLAKTGTGVTITATVVPDFDSANAKTGTALLTATATETRVSRRLEGCGLGQAQFVQYQIGDAAAISNAWTLDRLTITATKQEAVSA